MAEKNYTHTEMAKAIFQKNCPQFAQMTALPVRHRMTGEGYLISVSRIGDRFIQRSIEPTIMIRKDTQLDPWSLRSVFEKIKTEAELEAFLAICGPFKLSKLPQETTLEEFKQCQRFIHQIRARSGTFDWPDLPGVQDYDFITEAPNMLWGWPPPGEKNGRPWLLFQTRTTLEVIGATLFVDRMEGVKVQKCLWENCGQLYDIQSAHESRYCCDSHRQLAAQKRRREDVKKKKAEAEALNA